MILTYQMVFESNLKKSLHSRAIWNASRSDPLSSGTLELQAGANMNLAGNWKKDCTGTTSDVGSGGNCCNDQQVHVQRSKALMVSDKASENVAFCFSSVVSSPIKAPTPSFKFDVYCEDGIQLCVDLNSNPSDWIESLKAGVHIAHNVHKSQGFHEDVDHVCSSKFMKSSDEEVNTGCSIDASQPKRMVAGLQEPADESDGVGKSFSSPERIWEYQTVLSSLPETDTAKQVCGAKYRREKDEKVPADSDRNLVSQIDTCNFSGNSEPSGSNCLVVLENENLNVLSAINEKPSSQGANGLFESLLKRRRVPSSALSKVTTSSCAILGQDPSHPPARVSCVLSADQPQNTPTEHYELTHSDEFIQTACQSLAVGIDHQRKYATSSACMESNLSDLADLKHNLDSEYGEKAISSKSSWRIPEQTLLATRRRKNRSLSPCEVYKPQGIVNLTDHMKLASGGIKCLPQASGVATKMYSSGRVGVQGYNSSLSVSSNGQPVEYVVPEQNAVEHCTPTFSNELDRDFNKEQTRTCTGNLGTAGARHGKESTECLNFTHRTQKTQGKPDVSVSKKDVEGNRQFNEVVDHCTSVNNSDAMVIRSPKQFDGDFRARRRRSSRLSSKVSLTQYFTWTPGLLDTQKQTEAIYLLCILPLPSTLFCEL